MGREISRPAPLWLDFVQRSNNSDYFIVLTWTSATCLTLYQCTVPTLHNVKMIKCIWCLCCSSRLTWVHAEDYKYSQDTKKKTTSGTTHRLLTLTDSSYTCLVVTRPCTHMLHKHNTQLKGTIHRLTNAPELLHLQRSIVSSLFFENKEEKELQWIHYNQSVHFF